MDLKDILHRDPAPQPWAEGEKIPWNEPAFSARMLKEHLSQAHDAASRRIERIERHVSWLHNAVLGATPARVLDLGCGPGLYSSRLARLGHTCTGIDFSPASVAYARETAEKEGLPCNYRLEDVREADFGSGWEMIMFIYGELNVFKPTEAQAVLNQAGSALAPGGRLVLEVHTFDAVDRLGHTPPRWFSAEQGLFSAEPHLWLHEAFWDDTACDAIERYYVVDVATARVTKMASTTQAYTEAQYRKMLAQAGFGRVSVYPSLSGVHDEQSADFVAIVAD